MIKATVLNHTTFVVDDLEKAVAFYVNELGLEEIPAYGFDYPAAFLRINATQQLHLTEWEDTRSFRGHIALRVDQFKEAFERFRALGIIDVRPWGRVRKLGDGVWQMWIRDPAGNLIEINSHPNAQVDESFRTDHVWCQEHDGPWMSGRNDPRGKRGAGASLYGPEAS